MNYDNAFWRAVRIQNSRGKFIGDGIYSLSHRRFDRESKDLCWQSKAIHKIEALKVAEKWVQNEDSFEKNESMLKKARQGKERIPRLPD